MPSRTRLPCATTATPRMPSRIAPPVVSGSISRRRPPSASRMSSPRSPRSDDQRRIPPTQRPPSRSWRSSGATLPVTRRSITSASSASRSAPFGVAVDDPLRPASAAWASITDAGVLLGLLARPGSSAARARPLPGQPRERGAGHAELNEVLAADTVPRRRRSKVGGPGQDEATPPGPAGNTRRAPHCEQRGGHRRSDRPGADRMPSRNALLSAASAAVGHGRTPGVRVARRRPGPDRWEITSGASTTSAPSLIRGAPRDRRVRRTAMPSARSCSDPARSAPTSRPVRHPRRRRRP